MTRRLTGDKCSNCSVLLSCTQLVPGSSSITTTTKTESPVRENSIVVIEGSNNYGGSSLKDRKSNKVVSVVLDLNNGEYKTVNVAGAPTKIFYLECLYSTDIANRNNLRNNLVLYENCLFTFPDCANFFINFSCSVNATRF